MKDPDRSGEFARTRIPLVLAVAGAVLPATLTADTMVVTQKSDVQELCRRVQPGDVLVLQNGEWKDADLKFERLHGQPESHIFIRAETPGHVVFSGASAFRVSGSYVDVSGFVFRDVDGISDVVQLRTHSERHAHHCRFFDCVFEQSPDSRQGIESRWLSVYGTHNRIDHCRFVGKKSRGPTLVVWVEGDAGEHRIDHNYFGFRPDLGRNGGETIRIGTSEVSEFSCRTVVEDNFFERCNGEAEIISNKACENVYRHNVFVSCAGALTLRHGHRCTVDGNVFLGNQKNGTGGVRIIGSDHVITNNYFEGLRGDAERAAICLMNGIPDSPLNGYAPVQRAQVRHNTFIDCKVTFEIGHGAGRKQRAAPTDCSVTHNLVDAGKWFVFRMHARPVRLTWEENLLKPGTREQELPFMFRLKEVDFLPRDDLMLRPANVAQLRTPQSSSIETDVDAQPRSEKDLAGCDDPSTSRRAFVSETTTGPEWMRTQH